MEVILKGKVAIYCKTSTFNETRAVDTTRKKHAKNCALKSEKETCNLPKSSLQQEVAVALQANTSLQEALKSVALPAKTIDNVST